MQSRPLFRLRQGHLVRLRHARRRRPRELPRGGAVHLPLTAVGSGHPRRLVAAVVAAPVLFVVLVTTGGGWAPQPPATWTVLVAAAAAVGASTLSSYVPRAGERLGDAVGCAPCAAMPALSVVGAALLLAMSPHQAPMALAALAVVVIALLQRRSSVGAACPT